MAYKYKPNRKPDPRRRPVLKFSEFCPPRHDVVGPKPEHKGLCRCGCGQKLEGRQRQWRNGHEAIPLRDFKIARGDTGVIRTAIFERDRGICAGCGLDTEAEALKCHLWKRDVPEPQRSEANAMREKYMLAGFPSPDFSRSRGQTRAGTNWWQADHVVPIVEGGANTLANLRTLCIVCHKLETKRLAARRARAKAPDRTIPFAFAALDPRLTANLP